MFKERLTRPEAGNKYYIRKDSGGYAIGIIEGSPKDALCDVLHNCVGYAAGRFNEIIGQNCFVYFQYAGNPNTWRANAIQHGLQVGNKPKLGAVLVGSHHVAIVERINADGSILTSESGYNCKNAFWTQTRKEGSGANKWGMDGFDCFIYQPVDYDKGETPMMKGIDISACQPLIDWDKLATETQFILLQIGGGTNKRGVDAKFEEYYAKAKEKGIPVGGYWFIHAMNEAEAIEEADICLKLMKGKQFEFPIWLDLERPAQFELGAEKVSAIIRAFLDRVERCGYWVGLYTNSSSLKTHIADDIKKRYSIWVAHWGVDKPAYTGEYGIWQYSEKGTLNSIKPVNGKAVTVDLDYCYIDYPKTIKAKGLNGFGQTTEQPKEDKRETIEVTLTQNGATYKGTLTKI